MAMNANAAPYMQYSALLGMTSKIVTTFPPPIINTIAIPNLLSHKFVVLIYLISSPILKANIYTICATKKNPVPIINS